MPGRRQLIHRGELWDADLPGMDRHTFVVISREEALPVLTSVVCVLVTSKLRRHIAEVTIGNDEGMPGESAINCDNIFTIPVRNLLNKRGELGPEKTYQLARALQAALGIWV